MNTPETNQDGYLQAKQQIVELELVPWLMRMMVRRLGVMEESRLVFCERLHSSLNKAILTSRNAEVLDQFCQ